MAGGAQKKMMSVANATGQISKQAGILGREVKHTNGSLEQLKSHLNKLEGLQAKAFDPKHIQNYQRAINKVKADIDKWHSNKQLPEPKQGWFSRMKGQMGTALSNSPIGGYMDMLKSPALMAGAAAVALTTFGTMKAQDSMRFEYGMSKINATAQLSTDTLGKLKNRLLDIGSASGGNFDRITNAYEKIISTTGKVNLSLAITETAVKGAKAGFADIDLVAGALAQTLAVVGSQNTTANEVMDTLLKAKAVGAGEFSDFAQFLPQLIAAGRNLGIGFKDTAGLFSFMTFKGQSATDSAMLLQNAFTSLQKKDIIVGLKTKGIDLFNINGTRKNIAVVFTEITKKLEKMTDKQRTKFMLDIGLNDAQARSAWSVLTSDAENFKRVMSEVNDSIGETNKQLELTGSRTRTWADIGDKWKKIGVQLGDMLMPIVDALTVLTSGLINGIADILSGDMFLKAFGLDKGSLNENRSQLISEGAFKSASQEYMKKFGSSPSSLGEANNPGHQKFFKDRLQHWNAEWERLMGGGNPNKIDPNEKDSGPRTPESILSGIDNTSFGDDKETKSGKNSGLRTLIMNLTVNNNNEVKENQDMERLKRKMTDTIVDAARDGMVTVGV